MLQALRLACEETSKTYQGTEVHLMTLNARKEFHEAEAKKADDEMTKVLTDGMKITWTKKAA